jgi:flagellar basal-body rod protein FlgC
MSFLNTLSVSASGMTAERLRMDVVADNLANVNTTRGPNGGAYRRHRVLFESRPESGGFGGALARAMGRGDAGVAGLSGVRVRAVEEDAAPPRRVYDPGHPDAKPDGYVEMPNISTVTEMVDMMSATRAYEANVSAIQAAKQMAMKALDIARS